MTKKFLNGIDLSSQRLQNMADGSSPTDAATKQQLDAAVRGLDWKPSVRAATTANITLSAPQTVDGVAVIAGDSVLVKNQTTASGNGVYLVAAGAWTRRVDADESAEVTSGLTVTVTEGTTKGSGTSTANPLAWTLSTVDPITIGTTALTFVAVGGGGSTYTAGSGLSLTGSTFAVVPGSGIIADGTSTRIDTSVVTRKFATNVGDGTTTAITVTHNLATLDVAVTLVEVSTGATVETDITRPTVNTATLTFAVAPTTGQYRCLVQG